MNKILSYIIALLTVTGIWACNITPNTNTETVNNSVKSLYTPVETSTTVQNIDTIETILSVELSGTYTDKQHVALYIKQFKKLPSNYITKREATELGWVNTKGNLNKVAPGKSIGGDRFGNYEKLLPTANKRNYTECDIDYRSGPRNAKRIIYSNDGLIFYTEDHYKTFEQLY